MTQSFQPEDSLRVPTATADVDYDTSDPAAITYPNSWIIPEGGHAPTETVEQAHPRLFYVQEPHEKPHTSDVWKAGTLNIPVDGTIGVSQPVLLLGPNSKRKQVAIQCLQGNLFIGPDRSIGNISAGGTPVSGAWIAGFVFATLTTTGAIYAVATQGDTIVSFIEESYP